MPVASATAAATDATRVPDPVTGSGGAAADWMPGAAKVPDVADVEHVPGTVDAGGRPPASTDTSAVHSGGICARARGDAGPSPSTQPTRPAATRRRPCFRPGRAALAPPSSERGRCVATATDVSVLLAVIVFLFVRVRGVPAARPAARFRGRLGGRRS
jgi:hypothetical protein